MVNEADKTDSNSFYILHNKRSWVDCLYLSKLIGMICFNIFTKHPEIKHLWKFASHHHHHIDSSSYPPWQSSIRGNKCCGQFTWQTRLTRWPSRRAWHSSHYVWRQGWIFARNYFKNKMTLKIYSNYLC